MNIYEAIESDAKKDLLENKFGPTAYIIDNDKIDKVLYFDLPDDETKWPTFQGIGQVCSESNCHEVVIVLDCCMRKVNPEESDYINENWETERPTTYPESMRKDMIMVNTINFKKTDCLKIISYENGPEGIRITDETKYDINSEGNIRAALAYGFVQDQAKKEIALGNDNPEKIYQRLNEQFPNLKAEEVNG